LKVLPRTDFLASNSLSMFCFHSISSRRHIVVLDEGKASVYWYCWKNWL